jgi:hypothetical protein
MIYFLRAGPDGHMILWRAFCQRRTRRVLNAAERWLAWAPESGTIRTERLMNAANRWLPHERG